MSLGVRGMVFSLLLPVPRAVAAGAARTPAFPPCRDLSRPLAARNFHQCPKEADFVARLSSKVFAP